MNNNNNDTPKQLSLVDLENYSLIAQKEIFAAKRALKKAGAKQNSSQSVQHIIDEINEREKEDAQNANAIGYMTRAIVAASLPRSRPSNPFEFRRQAGEYSLIMHVAKALHDDYGMCIPYGPVPRLILLWLTTQVTLGKQQTIDLGNSRSDFIRRIGLTPRSGPRGNIGTVEQQLKNLLATVFTAVWGTGDVKKGGLALKHRTLASDAKLWWDNTEATRKFESTLTLDTAFYTEMLQGGVPVNLSVVESFLDNSMALDIYTFLTYRFSSLRKQLVMPWEWLYDQFGASEFDDSDIGRKNFRSYFRRNLRDVLSHYTEANVADNAQGLILLPSPPHVPFKKH